MIHAVVFDMDGVIIDSEPVYDNWLNLFLKNNEIEISESERKLTHGMSSQDFIKKVEYWWTRSGKKFRSGKEINLMYEKFCSHFSISFKEIQDPEIAKVMQELKRKKYKIAVASSSSMKHIKHVLKETELEKYVDVVASGENFRQSKPSPEIYRFTIDQLGFNNSECIAVEDSTYGIKAAVGAGIKVIAKSDERFGFEQSCADYRAEKLIQVLDIIEAVNSMDN